MSHMPKLNAAGTAWVSNAWDASNGNAQEQSADSGNVANATAAATLAAVAGKTNVLKGFDLTIAGATAGSIVNVTVTGLLGGTRTFPVAVPTGVGLLTPITQNFNPPLPAAAPNTAITVSMAALGLGNTLARTVARGDYL